MKQTVTVDQSAEPSPGGIPAGEAPQGICSKVFILAVFVDFVL